MEEGVKQTKTELECNGNPARWSINTVALPEIVRVSRAVASGLFRLALVISLFLRLPALASGTATLAWNPSADPLVAGYYLYYGGASRAYTNRISVGNATNIKVSGLVGGLTYYFAVTAYSLVGLESPFSGEVSCLVPAPAFLSIQVDRSNGIPVSVSIAASGTIPDQWTLQSSTNLEAWTTIAQGTNPAVNVSMPAGNLPAQFFRLVGQ